MQGNISNARAEVHNLDVEALIAQFKEVSSVIAELPDLGSVDGDLRKLDKYLGDVAARQAQLHNASAVVDLVGRLISYSIPRAMTQLSVRMRGEHRRSAPPAHCARPRSLHHSIASAMLPVRPGWWTWWQYKPRHCTRKL